MAINYKNNLVSGIGQTFTTVYNPTTTGVQSTVIGMNISNSSNTAVTANVTLTSAGTTSNVVRNIVIYAGTTLNAIDNSKLIVEQNDYIQVNSSVAGAVDVIISTVEVS
jgi:hypothetical protein